MTPAEASDDTAMRATLDALARELAKSEDIAAVQILALGDAADEVRMLGMAGFSESADFTERLAECRRRGARPLFTEAFMTGAPVVVMHRRDEHLADPAWGPLSEFMGGPDWDGFVSMPLLSQGHALGVINAYLRTGVEPDRETIEFLRAKADQAAIAVDTVSLLARTRSQARADARRRLARDLYASLDRQLVTLKRRAEEIRAQAGQPGPGQPGRGQPGPGQARLRTETGELAELAATALADLRTLTAELGPGELDLFKEAEPERLGSAVRAAAAGESHADPVPESRFPLRTPVAGAAPVAGALAVAGLTRREGEILALIGRGYSNSEIAAELAISERTARTHVSNVLAKLGLASRTQAALLAVREGLA